MIAITGSTENIKKLDGARKNEKWVPRMRQRNAYKIKCCTDTRIDDYDTL